MPVHLELAGVGDLDLGGALARLASEGLDLEYKRRTLKSEFKMYILMLF